MGSVRTTYDIVTRYMVQNQGGPHVTQMTQQVRQLERATSSATFGFGRIGAMVAGYLGFRQANASLIQFNSGMEQAKIQMAGLMAQAGRGDFTGNMASAAKLVKQMQIDARASVGTTQDFVQMASLLVQPLTMAGASLENIRDMTKQSVVGSRAMGIDAMVAARDVDQAIRGMYRSVDQFTGKLLTPMGFGGEAGRRKFNALSMEERFATLQRALSSTAIGDMAKAQETSFAGVTSTLEDTIQMTLGRVGVPVFKKITEEVRRWNDWLQKNQTLVDHIADVVGNKLLQAAISFKNAIKFAAEHWKSIALGYGALKSAGFLAAGGGMITNAAGQVTGAGKSAKIAAASLVVSVAYIGALEVSKMLDRRQSRVISDAGKFEGMPGLLSGARTDYGQGAAFKQMMMTSGFASASGANVGSIAKALEVTDISKRRQLAQALGLPMRTGTGWRDIETNPQAVAEAMARRYAEVLRDEAARADLNTSDLMGGYYGVALGRKMALPKVTKPVVNVTINRIQVATNDEDRFAFGLVRALGDATKNPSGVGAAIRALREG